MKKYYFVGICGVSMSSLALFMQSEGNLVRGYDKENSQQLTCKGIEIDNEINLTNIDWADEIIYSSAFDEQFEPIAYALQQKKKVKVRGKFLAEIAEGYEKVIAVAGSHGKSTVTALIYNILKIAGKNPSLHVGAKLIELGRSYDICGKEYFVTEACEYHDNFLFLHPYLSVITNVESEHLDYFKSFARERRSFEKFKQQSEISVSQNKLWVKNLKTDEKGNISFCIMDGEQARFKIKMKIGGKYNAQNAAIAAEAAIRLGISDCYIKYGLESFRGLQKRFEKVESNIASTVILDYAHHPKEICAVYDCIKNMRAKKVAVFQPHTYSRTKAFMDDFVKSLSKFDEVILFKTFSAREKEQREVEVKLVHLLAEHKKVIMFYDINALTNKLSCYHDDAIICIMGAGNLPELLQERKFIWRV